LHAESEQSALQELKKFLESQSGDKAQGQQEVQDYLLGLLKASTGAGSTAWAVMGMGATELKMLMQLLMSPQLHQELAILAIQRQPMQQTTKQLYSGPFWRQPQNIKQGFDCFMVVCSCGTCVPAGGLRAEEAAPASG
jgi:hypothetical protein